MSANSRPEPGTVYVLGAGHAGKLALAAARDVAPEATLVAVDVDEAAVERTTDLGLADIGVATDLRDPVGALESVRAAGAPPADLTVVVVNATGCEPSAILLTEDEGTVLFFSMATSFSAVALDVGRAVVERDDGGRHRLRARPRRLRARPRAALARAARGDGRGERSAA